MTNRSSAGTLIVTGGSRGIGASCARLGAAAGYRVVVNYSQNRDAALKVVADIQSAGGSAMAVGADVSRAEEVARLFAEADRAFGPVSALINNAGIGGAIRPVHEHTTETVDEIFRTNFNSMVFCSGEAVRRMSTAQGGAGGVIVNISSAAARLGGMTNMVIYAASKGAVDSFTVGLAREVSQQGIRVVGIRPGVTQTDILGPMGGDALIKQISSAIPLGRVGQADEIAQAAVWLLSPAASYVHGTTIDVSGGR